MKRALVAALLALGCASHPSATEPDAAEPDAGPPPSLEIPWRPAYPPRVLFHDPAVRCEPPGSYGYEPVPPRPSFVPGELVWSFDIDTDPAAVMRRAEIGYSPAPLPVARPIRVLPDGGVLREERDFVLGLDAEGALAFLERMDRDVPPATWIPAGSRFVQRSGAALVHRGFPTPPPPSIAPRVTVPRDDPSYPALPALDGASAASAQVMLPDGTLAWMSSARTLSMACWNDGALRTVIEIDRPPAVTPLLVPRADGTLIFVAWEVSLLDTSGAVLASASIGPRSDAELRRGAAITLAYSETCGLAYWRPQYGRAGWLRGDDLEPVPEIDVERHRGKFEGGDVSPGSIYATARCELLVIDTEHVRRLAEDGREIYDVTPPPAYRFFALADGGFAAVHEGRVAVYDGEGLAHDPALELVGSQALAITPDGLLITAFFHGYRAYALGTAADPLAHADAGEGGSWPR